MAYEKKKIYVSREVDGINKLLTLYSDKNNIGIFFTLKHSELILPL